MEPFTRDENTNPQERSLADHGWQGPVEKYTLDVSEGHIHVWGSEKNPGECHEEKSESHSEKFRPLRYPRFSHNVAGISAIQAENKQRKKQQRMDEAPQHKSPIGAMPETADQENEKCVSDRIPFAISRPTKRDVQVVSEPSRKRDVPTTPELGDVSREIGHLEIGHQSNAKQACCSDGNVTVAREVTVNLEREIDAT